MRNITTAVLTCGLDQPCRQTKYAAIPINKNRIVQTGANTQLGGAMLGFLIVAYQVSMFGLVKIDPINPALRLITTLINNFVISFIYASNKLNIIIFAIKNQYL